MATNYPQLAAQQDPLGCIYAVLSHLDMYWKGHFTTKVRWANQCHVYGNQADKLLDVAIRYGIVQTAGNKIILQHDIFQRTRKKRKKKNKQYFSNKQKTAKTAKVVGH